MRGLSVATILLTLLASALPANADYSSYLGLAEHPNASIIQRVGWAKCGPNPWWADGNSCCCYDQKNGHYCTHYNGGHASCTYVCMHEVTFCP